MPAPKYNGTAGDAVGNVLPFRVGPWVSYEPPSSSHTSTFGVMDDDVDMDAPQISTLRDEQTPPPPKANNPRFKLKLVVKDKTKTITSSAGKPYTGDDEEGEEEEEDQEDQLIDDDDGPIPAASLSSKRKAGTAAPGGSGKRKARKSDHGKKSEVGDGSVQGKPKEKVTQQPGAPNLAPTMSWFQANPITEQLEDSGTEGRISISHEDPDAPLALSATSKKKGTSKKTPSKKAKTLSTKLKLRMPQMPPEDTVSEGMTGTAASSPIGIHIDDSYSPEPEEANASSNIPIETSENTSTAQNPEQPINLEEVPVPIYPLPTKPFPVLPPPKISSGFAPNIPLDKTKTRVRHWRVANREIRGIAGGRWFTRAWVGEKESEFATVLLAGKATNVANGDGIGPPLGKIAGGGHSVSAPPGGKGSKKKVTNSSRSGSSVPEANGPVTASVHGPSKMRISQMAPPPPPSSEAGDIDMVVSAA
ncbi:hypothetical protein E1B28_001696 [Marasmius oreades]|uniref:Uncharacterized protein n=1 Tax=Marasmius oreades TaxID=181124 RepID=A0A9P7V3Y9_9AGAR|nr:uncharacterized protein E1B28_001696 [Marasmius oreades]KAG7099895.1 hypothetical protein E1B28_001696 [Marasmius oreades]